MSKYAIAIHGGAGTILRTFMTEEKELAYKTALEDALIIGEEILKLDGSALDAVEAIVRTLENNDLFNAGKGAVFTNEGKIELDASIMCGRTFMAGAIAGVKNVKNPVSLARTVMEKSDFVFLSGKGAEDFARIMHLDFEPDEYFFSQYRYDQLMLVKDTEETIMDHNPMPGQEKKYGTVGAVVLDTHGNIAAATSTGGMTNKRFGRIGDSPVIGSGTYANNNTCGVSCTGYGEYFLRSVVSHDISCLMEYKGLSLKEACDVVVNHKLVKLGGEGGLIAVDSKGNVELVFNSEGMYRAKVVMGEERYIAIYKEPEAV